MRAVVLLALGAPVHAPHEGGAKAAGATEGRAQQRTPPPYCSWDGRASAVQRLHAPDRRPQVRASLRKGTVCRPARTPSHRVSFPCPAPHGLRFACIHCQFEACLGCELKHKMGHALKIHH